jgi:hypothetical protein
LSPISNSPRTGPKAERHSALSRSRENVTPCAAAGARRSVSWQERRSWTPSLALLWPLSCRAFAGSDCVIRVFGGELTPPAQYQARLPGFAFRSDLNSAPSQGPPRNAWCLDLRTLQPFVG